MARRRRPLIDLTIPPRYDSVVAVRAELDRLPDPELTEAREDLELLVTELLTNSVRHAGMGEHERIGLRVSETPPTLRVEVSDPGRGFDHEVREPPAGSPGGRGLLLVHRIARRWGIGSDGGTRVWFEIPWRPRRRPPARRPADHAKGAVVGPSRSRSRS